MDFLDPKKKRAHKIRLYIGYALMAIALSIATLLLVFSAYGYDIDRRTGDIIQNGLIIVDAHPEQANIYVDGVHKGTTDNRLVLPASTYSLELRRDGYRSWKHDVQLEGSTIEQLVYPFLYPEKIQTKNVQSYKNIPVMASESPDRKWLVIAVNESPGTFQVVDLSDNKNPMTTISLPADTMNREAVNQVFEAVEWSTNNNHLLLKHTFDGGTEYIMLDRSSPANSVNLDKAFINEPFTSVTLRDKKPDQFHLFNQTDGTVWMADSKARTSTLYLKNVVTYKSYQDKTVLYVTDTGNAEAVEVRMRHKDEDYLLRTLPRSDTYLMDMAGFSGRFYTVVGSKADGRMYIYKDPITDFERKPTITPQPFRAMVLPGAEYVSFSAIARFIAVQSGSNFAVYDAETNRQFKYDTELTLEPGQKATWMDGHRLLVNSQNSVRVFDFDGTNLHTLSSSVSTIIPFFDRDYNAMFTIASDKPGESVLLRSELKIVPDSN